MVPGTPVLRVPRMIRGCPGKDLVTGIVVREVTVR
jgi:hypothetical protein